MNSTTDTSLHAQITALITVVETLHETVKVTSDMLELRGHEIAGLREEVAQLKDNPIRQLFAWN